MFRILKLFSVPAFTNFQPIIATFFQIRKLGASFGCHCDVLSFVLLLVMRLLLVGLFLTYFFAILGMEIFGDQFENGSELGEYVTFKGFLWSMLTMFQVAGARSSCVLFTRDSVGLHNFKLA